MNKKILSILSPDNLIVGVLFLLIVFAFHSELEKMFLKHPFAFCSIFGLVIILYFCIVLIGKKLKVREEKSVKNKIIFISIIIVICAVLYLPMTLLLNQIIK